MSEETAFVRLTNLLCQATIDLEIKNLRKHIRDHPNSKVAVTINNLPGNKACGLKVKNRIFRYLNWLYRTPEGKKVKHICAKYAYLTTAIRAFGTGFLLLINPLVYINL